MDELLRMIEIEKDRITMLEHMVKECMKQTPVHVGDVVYTSGCLDIGIVEEVDIHGFPKAVLSADCGCGHYGGVSQCIWKPTGDNYPIELWREDRVLRKEVLISVRKRFGEH